MRSWRRLSIVEDLFRITSAISFATAILLGFRPGHAFLEVEGRHCGASRGHRSALVACLYVRCILQARIREGLVASCGGGSSPGLKLCTRFRKSGCADCLRRRAGEGIDEDRSRVGGVGGRVRRRRARHCHEDRASMMVVGEDVAIVMGRRQYGAGGGGGGVLAGCEVVTQATGRW